jgi:hypothetical protein
MQWYKRILSLQLALMVLIGTTGITLHKHYCLGHVKSVALFHEADNCNPGEDTCPADCCSDSMESFQVDEPLEKTAGNQVSFNQHFTVLIFTHVYEVDLNPEARNYFKKTLTYQPPDIPENIPVTIQSFLL